MKSGIRDQEAPGGLPPVPLNAQRGTPGAQRLAVYAHGYRARLRQALEDVYPALRHLLGETEFSTLAAAYAARHPSRHYNLSRAGERVPEFLAGWTLTSRLPFLPDLAALERLVSRAFHAPERPPRDLSGLAGLSPGDWEQLRFTFQPSVGVLSSAWPVLDLWQARAQPRDAIDIKVDGRAQAVLVYRQGVEVTCEAIEPSLYALLSRTLEGAPLGEACAHAVAQAPVEPSAIQAWFTRWGSRGLIAEWRVEG